MKIIAHETGWVLVLATGEELLEKLDEFAKEQHIEGAWLQGIGAAGQVTLGFYNTFTKEYEWQEFGGPLEITNLSGNAAKSEGEPFWHIHGTFADNHFQAIGGHVKKMLVGGTCELNITKVGITLARTFDETTGLKLI
jgi:predicted DNA-binding protein with PD1-like motif